METRNLVKILIMLFLLINTSAGWAEDWSHSNLYNMFLSVDSMDGESDGYAEFLTSQLCARCHDEKITEIMNTVHYTFRSENQYIDYPGGGMHGHYDRSSGMTGGNTLVNYSFNDNKRGCGKCHVGRYLPGTMNDIDQSTGMPIENIEKSRDGIDCLICHASQYNGRDRLVDETLDNGWVIKTWYQDRTWNAVKSIGKTKTELCLRCHYEAASTNERGTPFEAWNDVHIASPAFKGNACTRCHEVKQHKIPRGNFVSELFASDYRIGSLENAMKCEKCHSETPHLKKNHKILNRHLTFIACQTCHIPWTSGATFYSWTSDGTSVRYAREDAYSAYDTRDYLTEGKDERDIYEEYKLRPKYLWFNGTASFQAQPVGSRYDSGSKIWPFKPLHSGLPVDASGLVMADVLDDSTIQRALIGLGTMRPGDHPYATASDGAGTLGNRTPDSSLSTEMQGKMASMPLIFNLDREVLALTSNLGDAVNSAMTMTFFNLNAIGRFLGADSDSPLTGIFNGLYPGNDYSMALMPTGEYMQDEHGPNYPAGAYLTITHGVKNAKEALRCSDCHSSGSILSRNRFRVFDGDNSDGTPTFREASNWEVLGYESPIEKRVHQKIRYKKEGK